MWKGIDGRGLTLPKLQAHIDALPPTTWASGMTLHNTAAPTLSQWTPANRSQRILNLERFFRDERGWTSGPHAFVDDELVWLFTRFTDKGTHSPSWNGTRLGIEMVGDFRRGADDPKSGRGLGVVKNTVALFAMLHTKHGWDPHTIKLHKEDPRTTHDCPGSAIVKEDFIDDVLEYMGHAGDMPDDLVTPREPRRMSGIVINVAADDTLNVRPWPSTGSPPIGRLALGSPVSILSEAMNVKTKWYRIEPQGWVNAAFIQVGEQL